MSLQTHESASRPTWAALADEDDAGAPDEGAMVDQLDGEESQTSEPRGPRINVTNLEAFSGAAPPPLSSATFVRDALDPPAPPTEAPAPLDAGAMAIDDADTTFTIADGNDSAFAIVHSCFHFRHVVSPSIC
jgi:hypothetical protein